MPIDSFHLAAPKGAGAIALSNSGQYPATRNGLPCFYYRRQSARDGEYVHPQLGFRLSITPERRAKWAENFARMKANGVEVPVVEDHETKAKATVGYVVDAINSGEWYEEVHQYLGQDACNEALKNLISLGIHPNFKDGQGRVYGEAVQHSALTPVPVIPGQGDAVPIAASRGQQSDQLLFQLAADLRSKPMPLSLNLSDEQIARLRELLGGQEITPENVVGLIITQLQANRQMSRGDQDKQILALSADVANWKKQAADAQAQLAQLSAQAPKEPDAWTLSLLSRSLKTERESAITCGAVTAAVADEIDKLLLKDGKPTGLALSTVAGGSDPFAFMLWQVLKANKPSPASGEMSGMQTLSRQVPGDDGKNKPDPDAERKEIEARAKRLG